jgi:hypothetical protein
LIHEDGTEEETDIIPIAGNYLGSGRRIEPTYTRLKKHDSKVEGLRMELHGGQYPDKKGWKQQAVIEFLCDHGRTGLEGEPTEKRRHKKDEEPPKGDQGQEEDNTRSLQFTSYGLVDDMYVLRLDWRTKYACEHPGEEEEEEEGKSNHWGFFTWLIVL